MYTYLTVCATIRDLNTALGITSLCSMVIQHHAAELMRSVVLLGCGLMPPPLVVLA